MNPLSRVPLLVWFLVPTLIAVVIGVWFFSKSNLGQTQDESKPEPVSKSVERTQDFPIVARNHISEGTTGSGYNSNPPSSGPHWPSPAKNGIYDTAEPDERYIHNLEHGYIWVSYRTDAGDDAINKLKDIVRADGWKIVMTPRGKDDAKIALAAWGRVLNMDNLDEKKVKDFIKTYRNRGPEKTPD